MLSPLAFVVRSNGQRLTAPGGIGGTCVDLANEYLRLCYALPHVWLNAVDWQHVRLPGWRWVANTPTNFPPPNALVVWGPAASVVVGPFGHIALAIDADIMALVSFDQNWPEGHPCTFVDHVYDGVLGWHIPPSK